MCTPSSPKCVAKLCLRVGFGVALALFGIAHFKSMAGLQEMITAGFSPPFVGIASLWAYVLAALQIVGGVLLVANFRADIGAWCAGIALASIAIGMPLKAVIGTAPLPEVAPHVHSTLIWLLVYFFVVKSLCCGKGEKGATPATSGGAEHACPSC